jgi:hypothetical protein
MSDHETKAALRDGQGAIDGRAPPWRVSGIRFFCALVGGVFLYSTYAELRSGVIRSKWGSVAVSRADAPLVFWLLVALTFAAAVFFISRFFVRKQPFT